MTSPGVSNPYFSMIPVLAGRKKFKLCCVTMTQSSSGQTRLDHALELPPQNKTEWPGLHIGPTHYKHSGGSALFLSYTFWERMIPHVLLSFTKSLPMDGWHQGIIIPVAMVRLHCLSVFPMATEQLDVRSLQAVTYLPVLSKAQTQSWKLIKVS